MLTVHIANTFLTSKEGYMYFLYQDKMAGSHSEFSLYYIHTYTVILEIFIDKIFRLLNFLVN